MLDKESKIILVQDSFYPEKTTGALRPYDFLQTFLGKKINCVVYASDFDGRKSNSNFDHVEVNWIKTKKIIPVNDRGVNFSICVALNIIREIKRNPNAFFILSVPSFGPVILFYILYILGFRSKFWIDYRDLWAGDPYPCIGMKDKIFRKIGACIEGRVAEFSVGVSFVSEAMRKDYLSTIEYKSNKIHAKAHVIKAGINNRWIKSIVETRKPVEEVAKKINFFGTVDSFGGITELIDFCKKNKIELKKDGFRFSFFGNFKFWSEGVEHLIQEEIFEIHDRMPYESALCNMYSSFGCLIFGSYSEQRLNRKVFELLTLAERLIYVGGESQSKRVIDESKRQYLHLDAMTSFEEFKTINLLESERPYFFPQFEISNQIERIMVIEKD